MSEEIRNMSIDDFGDDGNNQLLDPQYQLTCVVMATVFSVGYILVTQNMIENFEVKNWWPTVWQVLAIVAVSFVGLCFSVIVRTSRSMLQHNREVPEWLQQRLTVATLFAVSIQCTVLLGYLTTFTGGTFYSPYVQSLLAMALLTPIFSNSKETVLLMAVVVSVIFALFGDWSNSGPPEGLEIPTAIFFGTPLIAMMIALANPLFGEARTAPLDWRWSWLSRKSSPRG